MTWQCVLGHNEAPDIWFHRPVGCIMRLSVSHYLSSSWFPYCLLIDFYLRAVRVYSALYGKCINGTHPCCGLQCLHVTYFPHTFLNLGETNGQLYHSWQYKHAYQKWVTHAIDKHSVSRMKRGLLCVDLTTLVCLMSSWWTIKLPTSQTDLIH